MEITAGLRELTERIGLALATVQKRTSLDQRSDAERIVGLFGLPGLQQAKIIGPASLVLRPAPAPSICRTNMLRLFS
jgi:hypothetical protein